jgi:alpha-glucosidase
VPVPWEADAPSFGFGPSGKSWLPQPPEYAEYAADRQRGVPGSTLELYRSLLALRKEHRLGRRRVQWVDLGEDVLGFDLEGDDGDTVRVVANTGEAPVPLDGDAEVLVSSATEQNLAKGVPTDVAVWLRMR